MPILVLIALFLFNFNAMASDTNGGWAVLGYGTETCQAFVTAATAATERSAISDEPDESTLKYIAFVMWMQGFLSATNKYMEDTWNIAGEHKIDNLVAGVDYFCRQDPAELFANSVQAVVKDLYPNRVEVGPE